MRDLQPNVPGILISLAKNSYSPKDRKALLKILSAEGKLIAKAMDFPVDVLKTAAGILERFPRKGNVQVGGLR